ncbi:MAG: hypothetical protein HY054_01875 [Proteobacteria bacterium]|nr:hypothetical protein [Pseudomonadota bacterium]
MRAVLLCLALALAACGEGRAPALHQQAAAGRALVFNAASETARNVTGDVVMDGPRLRFAKGATLLTRLVARREPAEPIAQGGPSFATAALGPPDIVVEVRSVTQQTLAPGAPSLCSNGGPPTYVALIYGQRSTRVTLMAFNGADAPGSAANKSWLCATFVYTAPDGVRTRQGVLL